MAAGKSLNVKLRYRRPSRNPVTGPEMDPTKEEVNIKYPDMASNLESLADSYLDPQPIMNGPIEPLNINTSFETENLATSASISAPPMGSISTADILSQRRQRKGKSGLKRSASTPNVRGHQNGDVGMTLVEKRRNKLGYHRTSIACSHCRRRKIRCLAAPDDPHNRCANCIRLKKECNFFPVDQQPPIERRPRAHSKAGTRTSNSSDSSPPLVGNHTFDHQEHFSPYHPMPMPSQGYPPSTGSWSNGLVSPMTRVDHRHSFDFGQPPQQQNHWHSPFPEPGPLSAGHSSPGDPWGRRHTDSPLTPGYSPHMSAPTSTVNSSIDSRSSFTSFAPPRNDPNWPAPGRSMSIGVVEDIPPNYHKNIYHPQPLSMEFRRRASEMQPPSLLTSAESSHTSMSESHMTPLSAPVSSPPSHWGIPTQWNTLPSSAVTKPTDFGTWYSEPTLAKVQEEEIPPHYGEQPAILYADSDH